VDETAAGRLSVFSELMEGGSLRDWIYSKDDEDAPGRLYDGTKSEALEHILDISIQSARGLHYAHTAKEPLIHKDVKPDNLLLTSDGIVKVSDFGISNLLLEGAGNDNDPSGVHTKVEKAPPLFEVLPLAGAGIRKETADHATD
jgi:serine/threonine protein kinase